MTQLVSEAGHVQTVVQAAPRPLSSTSLISPPPTTSVTAASRAAKSGNGSGNNTTGILKSGTTTQHHHNSHRATKRAGSNASINSHHSAHSHNTHTASISAHSPGSHSHDNDGRPKRVWKACERCRMKKTKCDGEFPCKRCKDDGLVCTAGTRKKTEYKQIPKGYAEVLENTQVALVATIHKLYAMVQSGQSWTLGEPELNERGQPVIHSIASKLGCIRPNNDPDLPFGSAIFPESDKDLNDLQSQLNDFHKQREAEQAAHPELTTSSTTTTVKTEEPTPTQTTSQQPAARKRLSAKALPPALLSASAPAANSLPLSFDAASASSLEDMDNLSDLEDHRKNMFGRGNRTSSSVQSAGTMSPQSLTFNDFDSVATTGTSQADSITMPTISSPTIASTTLHNWMAQPGMNLSNMNGMNGLNSMNGMSTIQHQQPAPSQQALEMQMRQQRIVNNLQNNRTLHYQQAQQQYSPEQLPLSTVSMSASNMTLAGSNPTFFAADMLPQNMFDFVIKPDMMSTDAMMGGVDPMIFDGSFDEPMMS